MEYRNTEWMNIYMNLVNQLKDVYHDNLKQVILYGSVANGTATEDSDIDIMAVVDLSHEGLRMLSDKLSDVVSDFDLQYLKVFSVIDIPYNEFEEWKDDLPFYRNVANEGITLYAT